MFGRLTPIHTRNESKRSTGIIHDYGGIYVGATTTQDSTAPNKSEQFEEWGHNNSHVIKLPRQNSTCGTVSNSSGDENKIATLDGSTSSTNIGFLKHRLNPAPETNDDASFNNPIQILPNQILDEEKIIKTRAQVYSDSCSNLGSQVAAYKTTNLVVNNDPHISKTEFPFPDDTINQLDDTEINNIEAISESSEVDNVVGPNTDDILPEHLQKNTESSSVKFGGKDTNALYRHSKEHKSIVKASIANIVILLFVIVMIIIIRIAGPVRGDNVTQYVAIVVILKLYRTFSTLIMAIYCFEVVNLLFYQTLNIIKDDIQNLCNVIYNIF